MNADFFKESLFAKVKNPTEVVIGTLRLVGNTERPSPETMDWAIDITNMGQDLLNPPSVEGWHTGIEWINSGTLMKRTNFTAELMGDLTRPGVKNIMGRLKSVEASPDAIVTACLNLMGPLDVEDDIKKELIEHAETFGPFDWDNDSDNENAAAVASEIIQLIVALREYQFA